MKESTKDVIESVGAGVLEAAVSAIPVFGGPMAVAVGKAMASAEARRTQNLILELRDDLELAIADGRIANPVEALSSDEFLANLSFVIRSLGETSSEMRRQRLRQALIHGTNRKWRRSAEFFTRLLTKFDEPHIEALAAAYEVVGRTHKRVLDGTRLVLLHLSAKGIHRPESYYDALFQQLAAEQLISVDGESRALREGPASAEELASASKSLKFTNLGMQFLDFLASPVEDPPDGNALEVVVDR